MKFNKNNIKDNSDDTIENDHISIWGLKEIFYVFIFDLVGVFYSLFTSLY